MKNLTSQQKHITREFVKTFCDETLFNIEDLCTEYVDKLYDMGCPGDFSNEALKEYVEDYVFGQLTDAFDDTDMLDAFVEYIYYEGNNWEPDNLKG